MDVIVRPQGPVKFVIKGEERATVEVAERSPTVRIIQSASPIPSPGSGAAPKVTWTPPSTQATWLIPHNLGFKPQVTILDPDGNLVYGNVQHLDLNTVSISFNAPFYGSAELG